MKEVHRDGKLSRSQDLTAWVGLAAAAVMLPGTARRAGDAAGEQLAAVREAIASPDAGTVTQLLGDGLWSVVGTVGPLLAVVAGVVVATIAGSATAAPAPVHPVIVVASCAMALLSCWVMAVQSGRLLRQASTDDLTGALNRRAFSERVHDVVPRALRRGEAVGVVAFDVDDFKQVNDRHGHLGADDLLAGLAAAWRSRLTPGAFLGRVGGDEFVVVLPGADEGSARRWAASVAASGPLPASAGVAALRPDDTVRTLLGRADADLFAAKDGRRAGTGTR